MNIYPAEVENEIVAAVDCVEDVAVIGIPDTTDDLGGSKSWQICSRASVRL
ncbi:hypothetical protein [Nocardia brasiliensis]|uniref:hypothetical protein n=1 Tax=Nocardia brasiliensis TaxID=37326 RepID=UPI0018960023|nr:hypothetical protein [Nocardia brasiliensis]MBF6130065.1 hypothetical protein [Nocardia brasiliensis]